MGAEEREGDPLCAALQALVYRAAVEVCVCVCVRARRNSPRPRPRIIPSHREQLQGPGFLAPLV